MTAFCKSETVSSTCIDCKSLPKNVSSLGSSHGLLYRKMSALFLITMCWTSWVCCYWQDVAGLYVPKSLQQKILPIKCAIGEQCTWIMFTLSSIHFLKSSDMFVVTENQQRPFRFLSILVFKNRQTTKIIFTIFFCTLNFWNRIFFENKSNKLFRSDIYLIAKTSSLWRRLMVCFFLCPRLTKVGWSVAIML